MSLVELLGPKCRYVPFCWQCWGLLASHDDLSDTPGRKVPGGQGRQMLPSLVRLSLDWKYMPAPHAVICLAWQLLPLWSRGANWPAVQAAHVLSDSVRLVPAATKEPAGHTEGHAFARHDVPVWLCAEEASAAPAAPVLPGW